MKDLKGGNHVNYDEMSKEELVKLIKDMENQRAFTYEDRMKLEILDQSPFTIWASDRDCIIKFWDGQCENHYGYTKEQAIGKDFVDLIVAEDEKTAARSDQIKIIDDGEVFHNLANDHGRNGNVLHLITICRRIKDIKSGELWNAEMGLIIDSLEEEKERLNRVIAESRKVKSCVDQFLATVDQYKEQFADRRRAINSSIINYEREAISQGKRREFKEAVSSVQNTIEKIDEQLNELIEDFRKRINQCKSYEECESTRQAFMRKHSEILVDFEGVILDIEEIAHDLQCSSSIITGRDAVMRDASDKNGILINKAHDLLMKAESEISEYRGLGADPDAYRMQLLKQRRDEIQKIKDRIDSFADEIHAEVMRANTDDKIVALRQKMELGFAEFEKELNKIRSDMD